MTWIALLPLLLVATLARGEVGNCPTPKLQDDFDLEKFAGTWYEIEATTLVDRMAKKCSTLIFEYREKGKAGLLLKYVTTLTSTARSEYHDITTPKSSEPAKLLVSPLKGSILPKKFSVSILDTDYETYAVAFSCHKLLFTNIQEVFIFSRTKTLDDKKKMEIYNMLNSRSISQRGLSKMNQDDKDCPAE